MAQLTFSQDNCHAPDYEQTAESNESNCEVGDEFQGEVASKDEFPRSVVEGTITQPSLTTLETKPDENDLVSKVAEKR